MFAGQQVECRALLKQMEGAWTPLHCDLMGSDVCMCMCVHCCKSGAGKYSISCIRALLLTDNEILLKWNHAAGFSQWKTQQQISKEGKVKKTFPLFY